MRMVDLIQKKKLGEALTHDEITYIITGYVNGDIPDYQISALLMAICFQGMTHAETVSLTTAMLYSGDTVDLSLIKGIKVDKHSTGGVGDTTSLIAAPLAAACGVPIAKMSGRGLGHTGGTVDKLESLPGVNPLQTIENFIDIVNRTGIAIVGQTGNLVPADKLLYALRDVTATVDSMPLIASSIMSKKLAAGCDAIVLDVKTGSGAFMQTKEAAFTLAKTMVDIGNNLGRKTCAIITDMNQPLGMAIGNKLEVMEAIQGLRGDIPLDDPLMRVSMLLAKHMLVLGKAAADHDEADRKLKEALYSGAALNKLRDMLIAMGGDGHVTDNPDELIDAKHIVEILSPESGYIGDMDTQKIGTAAQVLGAGRAKKTDIIDPSVGIIMRVRQGSRISIGQPIATIYANDQEKLAESKSLLLSAIDIVPTPPDYVPMVYGEVTD